MKFVSIFLFSMLSSIVLWSQEEYYEVVAKDGDGIFSMLRKEGLDPVKHYAAFIKLNEEHVIHGSELKLGVAYKVPVSSDSFKIKGVQIHLDDGHEVPLFDTELATMNRKGDKLEDAVYYLLIENNSNTQKSTIQGMVKSLSADLMVQGAQVYVLHVPTLDKENDSIGGQHMAVFGKCVEAINKRYLKHSKKYQRVLLLRTNNIQNARKINLALYHHKKSSDGQRLADNIQKMFQKQGATSPEFEDKEALFLAKNLLPTLTMLTLNSESKKGKQEQYSISVDESRFVNLLRNGMIKDYAELKFED